MGLINIVIYHHHQELENMNKNGYALSGSQKCACCQEFALSREFFIFPCTHGFHTDCLLQYVINHRCLDQSQLITVLKLEEQMSSLATNKKNKRLQMQLEYLQNELGMYFSYTIPT